MWNQSICTPPGFTTPYPPSTAPYPRSFASICGSFASLRLCVSPSLRCLVNNRILFFCPSINRQSTESCQSCKSCLRKLPRQYLSAFVCIINPKDREVLLSLATNGSDSKPTERQLELVGGPAALRSSASICGSQSPVLFAHFDPNLTPRLRANQPGVARYGTSVQIGFTSILRQVVTSVTDSRQSTYVDPPHLENRRNPNSAFF